MVVTDHVCAVLLPSMAGAESAFEVERIRNPAA